MIKYLTFVVAGLILLGCTNKKIADDQIRLFPLSDVRLLDGPFQHAMEVNRNYIMQMDPDRLLAPYLREAGLVPKAQPYGNWESYGLDGHTAGHYLSALSLLYAATGDPEAKQRLEYMLNELNVVQQKNQNGYLGGVPGGQQMWDEIASGNIRATNFSLNEKWVPWYNIHKIFAGLYDAYIHVGSELARTMLINVSDWAYNLVSGLSDEQIQNMLIAEHGGMNDVLAQVAQITENEKYLGLAKRFSHQMILDPLLRNEDALEGLHANTQIPKVIGFKRIADATGDTLWANAAKFFWETVVLHRSVSIGGNSVREHFHPKDDFSCMILDREGPETCNTYNMLKLSKQLYLSSGDLSYIDFYERALFNHILSSQHPEHGGLVYFTPMRPRHYRVYSQPELHFWCCVGTGIENHSQFGRLIYAHNENNLFVNLFISSELNWQEKGVRVTQKTRFPDHESSLLVLELERPRAFNINIRNPKWTENREVLISINGEKQQTNAESGKYISLNRRWQTGDSIEISLPMELHLEQMPDNSPHYSILYGPIVLGAKMDTTNLIGLIADESRMGHIAWGPLYPIHNSPLLINDGREFTQNLKRTNPDSLIFAIQSNIYPDKYKNKALVPFFRIHDARYMVYWQMAQSQDLDSIIGIITATERARIILDEKTIGRVAIGEQQSEVEHRLRGERTETGINQNRRWRHAYEWFSYEIRTDSRRARTLQIIYFGGDANRQFDILINDVLIATEHLDGSRGNIFFTVDYPIPARLNESNNNVFTVTFRAHEGSMAGGIYCLRILE